MFLINAWHSALGMPKFDEAWHRRDMADELEELREAKGFVATWSELSDVAYTYTRARWSGHRLERPIGWPLFCVGLLYMLPKYTLRWLFYRIAGRRTDKNARLHVVRNPRKTEKLRTVAEIHGLDPLKFEQEAKKLLQYWPLLP